MLVHVRKSKADAYLGETIQVSAKWRSWMKEVDKRIVAVVLTEITPQPPNIRKKKNQRRKAADVLLTKTAAVVVCPWEFSV